MAPLDDLPVVGSMFGIGLRESVYMIAALSIVHIVFYGCTFFMPMTYQLVTIWMLVIIFSGISIVLLYGVAMQQAYILTFWIWYALIFVVIMFMMMFLLGLVFCSKQKKKRVVTVFFGVLWYILLIYFILVVNSYRKEIIKNQQREGYNETSTELTPEERNNLTLKRVEKGSTNLFEEITETTTLTPDSKAENSSQNDNTTNSPYESSTETTMSLLRELKNILTEKPDPPGHQWNPIKHEHKLRKILVYP